MMWVPNEQIEKEEEVVEGVVYQYIPPMQEDVDPEQAKIARNLIVVESESSSQVPAFRQQPTTRLFVLPIGLRSRYLATFQVWSPIVVRPTRKEYPHTIVVFHWRRVESKTHSLKTWMDCL